MTDLSWETLDSDISYTCGGFDVINEQVQLPDGTAAEFDYLSENPSVVVLPFTSDGDVVLIEEWRQAVKRHNRGLPAGGLEGEESPEEAVHRELREETGYETDAIAHLTTVEPANGFSDAVFHYYVANDCKPTGSQHLDTDESIEVRKAPFSAVLESVRTGEIRDGRSAHALLYYALFERDL
ncbi:NUDIX hydrolase [Halovenus rubra]|uniref:NUDIX hydrolase n=2 Tax=Halovenus rubra TaxID=869890 RepID=A0ACC7DXU5_9EURY|nr:NUDIX hydrolase [Halovenus rubra]